MAREHALEQAADGPTGAGIDEGDAQVQRGDGGLGIERQLNVIDADDLAPVHVDNLLVEQIAFQQQHAFAAGILGQIGGAGRGVHATVDAAQQFGADDTISARSADDEGGDANGVILGDERNFAHASQLSGVGVIDGEAQQIGKCKCRHGNLVRNLNTRTTNSRLYYSQPSITRELFQKQTKAALMENRVRKIMIENRVRQFRLQSFSYGTHIAGATHAGWSTAYLWI